MARVRSRGRKPDVIPRLATAGLTWRNPRRNGVEASAALATAVRLTAKRPTARQHLRESNRNNHVGPLAVLALGQRADPRLDSGRRGIGRAVTAVRDLHGDCPVT
jgi:hypothetical protein